MDVLYSGLLKDNHPFYIRLLHLKDLDEIIHVQKAVFYVLDDPGSLSSLSQKEYEYILSDGGKIVGVFPDKRLVALGRGALHSDAKYKSSAKTSCRRMAGLFGIVNEHYHDTEIDNK
jgi:hypothetical protein